MRIRRTGRAVVVVSAALVTLWAFAPAGIAKPDKPGHGGGSRSSLAVDVVDRSGYKIWSILETPGEGPSGVGDQLAFRVTLDGAAIEGEVCVTFDAQPSASPWCGQVDSDGTTPLYSVQDDDITVDTRVFSGTATHETADGVLRASFELTKQDHDECFAGQSGDTYHGVFLDRTECRWHPNTPGVWQATLRPAIPGPKVKVEVSLRDHAPGNWCTTTADGAYAVSGRLRPGEEMGVEFYTPGPERSGICLRGGQNGTTIGVGNPATFLLVAQGDLTLTRVGSTP